MLQEFKVQRRTSKGMELLIKPKEIESKEEFMERFNENIPEYSMNKNICVFGQGFVGLPLALSFAFRGCNTIGVDVEESLVHEINCGKTYHTEKFYEVTIEEVLQMQLEDKRYKITIDADMAVRQCNNIIVTVGIPIKNGDYIMDHLESVCKIIGKNLKKDDLIIIRSTVIPGTTEEFCMPILEKESGMKAGEDFYLAYASERIAEGKAFDEFANMPTLVGAVNKKSLKRAIDVLSIVCKADVIPASCIKVVETSKVFENVQRDVNIAMSQEFARFTETFGIDIFEVINLANTHKRVDLLTPGPGVGGYCIPNAYHYIAPKAEKMCVDMPLLKLAREKNDVLPEFIANKVEELLYKQGKNIRGCKISVLGLAMKDYSNDDRISPPIDICRILINKGADVAAFDPVVPTHYDFKVGTQDESLKDADAVMVLTKQHEIDFTDCEHIAKIMKERPICIDTKNVIDKIQAKKYGIELWKI
ncbi:nucleotide sugar dehydrogenase [Clostridium sp. cpc1]|uniref:Nucleotide sugar dehydrogenase n=3 Tax=Clostridiaceae TaxID=31979 RepID=A0AAE6LY24_CLOSG|nr:nucleotide sugar dehydrogenase [Clostridium sp. cpc1]QDY33376.1 nucleotide sugar dehydrogenase [Clostridium sporogenes]